MGAIQPLNDQFEHGRIPLRVLSYKNKDLAQTCELLIDYGKTGDETWHIFIADMNDPTKFYDLTEMMVSHVLPNTHINANQFSINLDGIEEPTLLKDIFNYIYKRYLYPDQYGVFEYDNDKEKIFDASTRSTLLRSSDKQIFLPITLADNVFFKDGSSIQDYYNNVSRIAIKKQTLIAKSDNQSEFYFDYPFENYMDYYEVRLNGEYLLDGDYNIDPQIDNNHNYEVGKLTLLNTSINTGESIDIIFTYNAKAYPELALKYMDGKNITVQSIPTSRLAKVSDNWNLMDSSSLASSKAVASAYNEIIDLINEKDPYSVICMDRSIYNTYIHIDNTINITDHNSCIVNVITKTEKRSDCEVLIHFVHDAVTRYPIVDFDGAPLTKGLPKGKMLRLLWDKNNQYFRLVTTTINQLKESRYFYRCTEMMDKIPFDEMKYNIGAEIHVYKNGIRLFEDLDYYIDKKNEYITLSNRTNIGDMIVFEAFYL